MKDQDSAKLEVLLRRWDRAHPHWRQLSAEELATALAAEVDWDTVRLAGWMQTPDGTLITEVVERVIPYPYNYGADVLVNAIQIAGRQRTERQRGLTLAAGVGLATLLMLVLGKS